MEEINHEIKLYGTPERLTARRAFALVEPVVRLQDADARLVFMRSDEDISHKGFSNWWWLTFLLPARQAECRCQLYREPGSARKANPVVVLKASVEPFTCPPHLLAQAGRTLAEQWEAHLASRPGLPVPFRDSPEAVAALAEQGVDFIAGSTSMVLSAEALPSVGPVWQIYASKQEYQTPFAIGNESQ